MIFNKHKSVGFLATIQRKTTGTIVRIPCGTNIVEKKSDSEIMAKKLQKAVASCHPGWIVSVSWWDEKTYLKIVEHLENIEYAVDNSH